MISTVKIECVGTNGVTMAVVEEDGESGTRRTVAYQQNGEWCWINGLFCDPDTANEFDAMPVTSDEILCVEAYVGDVAKDGILSSMKGSLLAVAFVAVATPLTMAWLDVVHSFVYKPIKAWLLALLALLA